MRRALRKGKKIILLYKNKYLDRFIFIHINKTGGSSIEKALKLPLEHKTALEKIKEIGRARWDSKLTFTVVRNPWDKVVSHYHYRVQRNHPSLRDNPIEFNQWVKLAYGDNDPLYYDKPRMFMPQIKWIEDQKGNILVDEIVHFERLESELNKALNKVGVSVSLPHVKKSRHGSYRDYYNDETIEIVHNWFKRDIEMFGYRF